MTSAATDVNVVTPGKTQNDDSKEQPIPHQFVSSFQGQFFSSILFFILLSSLVLILFPSLSSARLFLLFDTGDKLVTKPVDHVGV